MNRYEICIVSKEYRYITVEAEDEVGARDKAWDKVACGYTCDVKAEDYDTEIFVEREIKEKEHEDL
jgi:hypothetical protein